MKTNLAIARALLRGPCLALAPDGAVDWDRNGRLLLPPSEAAKKRMRERGGFARGRKKGRAA